MAFPSDKSSELEMSDLKSTISALQKQTFFQCKQQKQVLCRASPANSLSCSHPPHPDAHVQHDNDNSLSHAPPPLPRFHSLFRCLVMPLSDFDIAGGSVFSHATQDTPFLSAKHRYNTTVTILSLMLHHPHPDSTLFFPPLSTGTAPQWQSSLMLHPPHPDSTLFFFPLSTATAPQWPTPASSLDQNGSAGPSIDGSLGRDNRCQPPPTGWVAYWARTRTWMPEKQRIENYQLIQLQHNTNRAWLVVLHIQETSPKVAIALYADQRTAWQSKQTLLHLSAKKTLHCIYPNPICSKAHAGFLKSRRSRGVRWQDRNSRWQNNNSLRSLFLHDIMTPIVQWVHQWSQPCQT